MHDASEMLHRQLHTYSDSWRAEGGGPVPPWQLEAWLETGLSIFRLIRRLDEHCGEAARAAAPAAAVPCSNEDTRDIESLYREWLRNAAGPLGRLSELEAAGCTVADAGEFRDAEREARGVLHVALDAALGAGEAPTVPEWGAAGQLPA